MPAGCGSIFVGNRLVRTHGAAAPVAVGLDPPFINTALVHGVATDRPGHMRFHGNPHEAGLCGKLHAAQRRDNPLGLGSGIAEWRSRDLEGFCSQARFDA